MSAVDLRAMGRLTPDLTEAQTRRWAHEVERHVAIDPLRRGPRWWALSFGLRGRQLDQVLIEMGEPLAPIGRVPIMRMVRRAHFMRQLLEA